MKFKAGNHAPIDAVGAAFDETMIEVPITDEMRSDLLTADEYAFRVQGTVSVFDEIFPAGTARQALPPVFKACLANPNNANAIVKNYQSCSGILSVSEGEYKLKPDAGSGLWCDASISSGEYGRANLVPKVLKVCAVGSRYRIKGTFEGHGVFYWNKI